MKVQMSLSQVARYFANLQLFTGRFANSELHCSMVAGVGRSYMAHKGGGCVKCHSRYEGPVDTAAAGTRPCFISQQ